MKKLSIALTVVLSGAFIIASSQNAQVQGVTAANSTTATSKTTPKRIELPPAHPKTYAPEPRVKTVPHHLHVAQPKMPPAKPAVQQPASK